MPDHPSKIKWEAENTVKVLLKVNRNQDPELYDLLQQANGSRGTILRDLAREGLKTYQQTK